MKKLKINGIIGHKCIVEMTLNEKIFRRMCVEVEEKRETIMRLIGPRVVKLRINTGIGDVVIDSEVWARKVD